MDSIVTSMPKITVLMPVFNCELYIREAVDSILNQTFTDFEFLIIDDASTDKTVSIIKSYKDSRIQLIEKITNTGYTKSLNYGLQVAKGEYVARMDGDDISLPERFAKQVAFLDANLDVVLCGTSYEIIGEKKKTIIPENHDEIKLALLRANCIAHPSVLIRKKALDEFFVVYDTSKEPAEDYNMWVRLLKIGKLHNLQEILLKYRIHITSVSRTRVEEQERNTIETRIQLLNYLGIYLEPFELELVRKSFKRISAVSFKEYKAFKHIQQKLLASNASCFFEPVGFEQFVIHLEADVLRKCFLRQKNYFPSVYFDYLKIKYKSEVRLTLFEEIKLIIKSMFFWKII